MGSDDIFLVAARLKPGAHVGTRLRIRGPASGAARGSPEPVGGRADEPQDHDHAMSVRVKRSPTRQQGSRKNSDCWSSSPAPAAFRWQSSAVGPSPEARRTEWSTIGMLPRRQQRVLEAGCEESQRRWDSQQRCAQVRSASPARPLPPTRVASCASISRESSACGWQFLAVRAVGHRGGRARPRMSRAGTSTLTARSTT